MTMKNILKYCAAAMTLLCAAHAPAQQTRMLTPEHYSEFGLVYALPLTGIEVEIEAEHVVRQAGPYYLYSKKYIGTADVIKEDSESWNVTGVRVRTYGMANDSALYRMQLKPGTPTELCVAPDGMLLAVNKQVDMPAGWPQLQNPEPLFLPAATEYLQYVGEDFISAQSDARRAEMLAEGLTEVREARLSLTRGTAESMPTDGHQLELMLQSLGHQEELMMNAFRGRTLNEKRSARYTLLPRKEGRYVLARLSDITGFVRADDLSGAPIEVNITRVANAEIPLDEKGNPMKMPKDGVMYVLPATMHVEICWEGATLWSGDLQMAQWGATFALDPALFTSKKTPAYAIFDPATGALLQVGQK